MSGTQSLSRLRENVKVRVDHDPMRRAFKLSVRVNDLVLNQEVDEMSLIGSSSPGDYIDAMTEHMMRKAQMMSEKMEQRMLQNNPMYYAQSPYGMTAPGNMYPGQSFPVQRQEDLMCVGNGWGQLQSLPATSAWDHAWQSGMSAARGFVKKHFQFFRINEDVQHEEGASFIEPLDELRLKVSRWLKGKL